MSVKAAKTRKRAYKRLGVVGLVVGDIEIHVGHPLDLTGHPLQRRQRNCAFVGSVGVADERDHMAGMSVQSEPDGGASDHLGFGSIAA